MADELESAVADAKKVLGKEADLPTKRIAAVRKLYGELLNELKTWKAAKEALEKRLIALQDLFAKYDNALSQAEDDMTGGSYGLDPKNADDKKKIDAAQKILSAWFKAAEEDVETNIKKLKEVDKHLMHVSEYKGPD